MQKRFRKYLVMFLCVSFLCPYFMTILQQGARSLVSAAAIPTKGVCTANELNVRSGPGTDYAQVKAGGKYVVLSKGQEVSILSEKKDWYEIKVKISGENVTGYCLSTYIKVTATATPTPTSKPKPTAAPTPDMVKTTVYNLSIPATITANELNFRRLADTDSEIYAVLKKDESVTVLGVKEADGYLWYYVSAKVNGKTKKGYIVSDYAAFTFKKNFYARTKEKMNLMTEAGGSKKVTNSDGKAVSVAKDKLLYIVSEQMKGGEKWLRVRVTVSGVKYYGYVRLSAINLAGVAQTVYVTPTPTPSIAPTPVDDEQEFSYAATITANSLNLREKASTKSDILTELSKNQKLTILNASAMEDGTWYRAALTAGKKDYVGYLFSPYVALDFPQEVYAKVVGGSLKLRSKANDKAVYVKKADESILSLAKGTSVKLVGETNVSGDKWFTVEVEVSGKVYRGFATADRLMLAAEPTKEPEPTPTSTPTPTKEEGPTPTPEEEDEPTPTPKEDELTPTPTPSATPTPSPSPTPTKAPTPTLPSKGQGKITEVTALALKELPQYGSKLIKNANGFSVVIDAENVFEVLDVVDDGENRWCHVVFKQDGIDYIGYINANYVRYVDGSEILDDPTQEVPTPIDPQPTPYPTDIPAVTDPADFEALLDAQNFPESYRQALRDLHALHPQWKFVANHTGLDWNTALDNESVVGKNLISNTKGAAWKSFETNAYNWKTDTFVVYDGSTWVTASREANAYYMDPRNFLDETNIFQFELLTYEPTYQTSAGVENILRGTAMEGQYVHYTDEYGNSKSATYAQIFEEAAQYSGVNPFHLASRVKQEIVVGANTLSNSVSGTVPGFEGLYNYYNIGAYHSTVAGGAIANGLKYAQNGAPNAAALNESMLIPWTDPYRAILGGAYYIGYSYINRGQNTIYLQKFNMTPTSTYSHQYMANVEAPYSEGRKVAGAYAEFGELPLVFSIPVYLNMPQEVCAEPGISYNPNNWLKSLSVKDASGNELFLTPTFDMTADQEYYIVVDHSCDMVEVSAEAVSHLATVSGNTWYPLADGNNELVIYVTAENGDVKEYRITVARSQ